MDKLLVAALMAALGISKAAAEEMIAGDKATNGEALADFNRLHPIKIAAIKEESRSAGYDKGKGEALTKFEDDLKEKFDVKSKKKGLDLVEEVITAKTPDPAKPDSISDDVVKKHPAFLKREKELTDALDEAKAEVETKVKEVQDGYTKKETQNIVISDALAKAKGMKVAFSTKPETAARQENILKKELLAKGYDFEIRGEGANKTILLKYAADTGEFKKGARVEDAHGNPVTFDNFVRETVLDAGLDFAAANPRTGLGGGDGKGGKKGEAPEADDAEKPKYAGKMPTTEAELVKIITDKKVPLEHRQEVQAYYDSQQESADNE